MLAKIFPLSAAMLLTRCRRMGREGWEKGPDPRGSNCCNLCISPAFPALLKEIKCSAGVLIRGMKRQMSITCDNECNHNCHLAWPQLCRWPLIHRGQDLPWLVIRWRKFPCTKGPTGTQLSRSACTQMRIYNWLMCLKLSKYSNILLNRERVPCWSNLSTYLNAMLSKGNSEC